MVTGKVASSTSMAKRDRSDERAFNSFKRLFGSWRSLIFNYQALNGLYV